MPTPTADEFLNVAVRARLLTDERAATLRAEAARRNLSGEELAKLLADADELTPFQCGKLLRGQWQGLVLGGFTILSPLGRGGMGIVYLALDAASPNLVALKILPPPKALAEPRTKARFLREMDLGADVPEHPNVATPLGCGTASGINFIAMEYVPGETLKALVSRTGPLAVPVAARLFAEIARGLHAAHQAGLIHRDLKPSNVMVTPTGDAKLLDFGFAIRIGEKLPDDPAIAGGVGYTLGTMDYIAPEQAANAAAVTPASDLYALGGTLYYALTGCPPFPGGTAAQKIRWHRTDAPPPLESLNPAVPPEIVAIANRLLAKNPADRHATAEAVAVDLDPWAEKTGRSLTTLEEPVVELTEADLWEEGREPREEVVGIRYAHLALGLAVVFALLAFACATGFVLRALSRRPF